MTAAARDTAIGEIALEARNLSVSAGSGHGSVTLVESIDFAVRRGEAVGLVGESGSGKSLTLRALQDVLPSGTRRTGAVDFGLRGSSQPARAALVFQEPLAALNPTMRIGDIIAEAALARGLHHRAARRVALELLDDVGIPQPSTRLRDWPHELSGGLRQRVMIAVALAADPDVLLCDEPTTALDVTVQAQILTLLDRLRADRGLALVFVSHDLGVVAQICDRIAVMYAGSIVEQGDLAEVAADPQHPYTAALIAAAPALDHRQQLLTSIPGAPPDPHTFSDGCRFAPRCSFAEAACRTEPPAPRQITADHFSACRRSGGEANFAADKEAQ